MENPPAFGDPDRMLSLNYTSDPGELDGGGVHSNSGVNNKAASLMVDGGTFNGQTITGLGITKAARIYYTVNNSMLISGSDYADLANALRQACTNLIGTAGIAAADCVEVNQIVLATQMDQNPTTSPTRTAAVCPTGNPLSTVLSDDLETNSGQLTTARVGEPLVLPPGAQPILVRRDVRDQRHKNVWGYDQPGTSDTFLRMTNPVALPANAYLHFNHAFGFDDDLGGAYDGGVLEYSTSGSGSPWVDAGPLFAATGTNGYPVPSRPASPTRFKDGQRSSGRATATAPAGPTWARWRGKT